MSLHSYSSFTRRFNKRTGSLEKFLAIPRHPMVLSRMNNPKDVSRAVQRGVEELAVRTAWCYKSFSDPVFTRSVRRANSEHLKWVQAYSLKEFEYCVALQDIAAKFVANGGVASLALTDPSTTAPSGGVASRLSFVRNTDDNTFVDERAVTAALPPTSRTALSTSHRAPQSTTDSPWRTAEKMGRAGARSETPSGTSAPDHDVAMLRYDTRRGFVTREEAELLLEMGLMEPIDLPFDLALEMLRPQESVLDVLVNETSLQSDQLNTWFSHFCRRRVAWRVLHEHLLFLIRPRANPTVVHDHTDLVELLQRAGSTVADIYAKLSISDSELVIHIEEDPSILTEEPRAALMTSSVDCIARSCEAGSCLPRATDTQISPPPSSSLYSVEGHLGYVFREVLKNACVATVRWTSDISLLVRFAVDDRWVVVDFVDHAGGIAPEHMHDIWTFGWTTSEHYESHLGGFGVGLPTSKVYMDMWGGSIDVYSTVNKGTTVRVRYPKCPTEVLVRPPSEEDTCDSRKTEA